MPNQIKVALLVSLVWLGAVLLSTFTTYYHVLLSRIYLADLSLFDSFFNLQSLYISSDFMYSTTSWGVVQILNRSRSPFLISRFSWRAFKMLFQKLPNKIMGLLFGSCIQLLIQVIPNSLRVPILPLKTIWTSVVWSITFVLSK